FQDGQTSGPVAFAPVIGGNAQFTLPVQVSPDPLALVAPGAQPVIQVNWADLTNPSTLKFSYDSDMDRLLDLRTLSAGSSIAGLDHVANYLASLEKSGLLAQKLPILNKSVGQILDFASQFQAWVNAFAQDPGVTIQTLLVQLDQAFGVAAGSPL